LHTKTLRTEEEEEEQEAKGDKARKCVPDAFRSSVNVYCSNFPQKQAQETSRKSSQKNPLKLQTKNSAKGAEEEEEEEAGISSSSIAMAKLRAPSLAS
jgi:hypothetical protein